MLEGRADRDAAEGVMTARRVSSVPGERGTGTHPDRVLVALPAVCELCS